jgi:hypothetical protein
LMRWGVGLTILIGACAASLVGGLTAIVEGWPATGFALLTLSAALNVLCRVMGRSSGMTSRWMHWLTPAYLAASGLAVLTLGILLCAGGSGLVPFVLALVTIGHMGLVIASERQGQPQQAEWHATPTAIIAILFAFLIIGSGVLGLAASALYGFVTLTHRQMQNIG